MAIISGVDDGKLILSIIFLGLSIIVWPASKPFVEWLARKTEEKHEKRRHGKHHHHHKHGKGKGKEKDEDKDEATLEREKTEALRSKSSAQVHVSISALTNQAARTLPQPVRWILCCAFLYGAVAALSSDWPEDSTLKRVAGIIGKLFVCVIIYKCLQVCKCFVDILQVYWMAKAAETEGKIDDMIVPLLVELLKKVLDVIFMVFGFENLGLDATTLIASVSVTGVALAFAAKDYVTALFGLLVIFTSHPFEVGDQIEVDGVRGVVIGVSLRYTTIVGRYTGEHELVPNSHFLTGGLVNISRRESIRMSLRWAICPEEVNYQDDEEDIKKARLPVIRRVQLLREELLHALDSDAEFVGGLSEVRIQMPDCRAMKAFSELPRGLEIRVHGSFTADPADWGRFCARESDYVLLVAQLMAKHNLRFAGPKTHFFLPDAPQEGLPSCSVRHDLEVAASDSWTSSPTSTMRSPSVPGKSPALPLNSPGVTRVAPQGGELGSSFDSSPVTRTSPKNLDQDPRGGFNMEKSSAPGTPALVEKSPDSSLQDVQCIAPLEVPERDFLGVDAQELLSMLTSMGDQIRSLSDRVVKLEQGFESNARATQADPPRSGLSLCAGPGSSMSK